MRTTLTLDPDVAQLLAEEVKRRRMSFKRVVNDAIRRALAPAVSDELEADGVLAKSARR